MVISAAITANLFNGLLTRVWTVWVFVAVFIGIVLVWLYTVRPPSCFSSSFALNDGFLGYLFAHLSRMVFDSRLRQRPLSVPIPYLLVWHLDHGHTCAGSEVPLPSVDLRLPPERPGHLELELQDEAEHGHHPRSHPGRRTGGGRRQQPHTGTYDAAQREVRRSPGAHVDAGQPHRHVHRPAFAVARIQLRAGGRRCRHAPHAEQSVGRCAYRYAPQRAQARDQHATLDDAPSAPSEAAPWGSSIMIWRNDFCCLCKPFSRRPSCFLSFLDALFLFLLIHTGWTQAHHAHDIYDLCTSLPRCNFLTPSILRSVLFFAL